MLSLPTLFWRHIFSEAVFIDARGSAGAFQLTPGKKSCYHGYQPTSYCAYRVLGEGVAELLVCDEPLDRRQRL